MTRTVEEIRAKYESLTPTGKAFLFDTTNEGTCITDALTLLAEIDKLREKLAALGGWNSADEPPPADSEYNTFTCSGDVEVLLVSRGFYERYKNVPQFNDEWKVYIFDKSRVIGWRYAQQPSTDPEGEQP